MIQALFLIFATLSFAADQPMALPLAGHFGGVRVQLPCSFASNPDGLCFVDLGGGESISRELPAGSHLSGQSTMGGIGWNMNCQDGHLDTFQFAGRTIENVAFTYCPDFPEDFAPVLGGNLFWGTISRWDFAHGLFRWEDSGLSDTEGFPLYRTGSNNAWIGFDLNWEGKTFSAMIDTGAPVTLVDPTVVAALPDAFEEESEIPVPPNVAKSGGKGYRVKKPFTVGGVELNATYVQAVDLVKIFGPELGPVRVIVGTLHLLPTTWTLDLIHLRGRVN